MACGGCGVQRSIAAQSASPVFGQLARSNSKGMRPANTATCELAPCSVKQLELRGGTLWTGTVPGLSWAGRKNNALFTEGLIGLT